MAARGVRTARTGVPDHCLKKEAREDGPILRSFMRETNGGGSLEIVPGYAPRRAVTDGFVAARLPTPPGYAPGLLRDAIGPSVYVGMQPMATGSILPLELQQPQFGAGLENVHGVDNRVVVPDTAMIPWRCICHLQVVFEDGVKGYGTGWLAGPRTVITAGHCVYDPRSNKRAAEIYITPGRNGPIGPYGQFVSSDYAVMEGWPDPKRPERDLAAIALPEDDANFPGGPGVRLGFFGVAAFSQPKLDMLLVNTSGYPLEARKPFGTQWYNAGRIKGVFDGYLTYMIDTEGGQSGSPVFFYDESEDQRLVVAVHTTGYYPNRGLRITEPILDAIQAWAVTPPKGQPAARRTSRKSQSRT